MVIGWLLETNTSLRFVLDYAPLRSAPSVLDCYIGKVIGFKKEVKIKPIFAEGILDTLLPIPAKVIFKFMGRGISV